MLKILNKKPENPILRILVPAGLVVLLMIATVLVMTLSGWLASFLVSLLHGYKYSSLDHERTAIFGLYRFFLPAFLVAFGTVALLGRQEGLRLLGFRFRPKAWHIIPLVLFLPVFYLMAIFLQELFDNFFSYIMYKSWKTSLSWHHQAIDDDDWGFIFYSVVCAPIGEEIIFRGWLYGWLRKIVPAKWFVPIAIIIASLLFAWIHRTTKFAITAFAFGVCLCALRESTDSIYPGIVIHSLWNLQTFF